MTQMTRVVRTMIQMIQMTPALVGQTNETGGIDKTTTNRSRSLSDLQLKILFF